MVPSCLVVGELWELTGAVENTTPLEAKVVRVTPAEPPTRGDLRRDWNWGVVEVQAELW